MIKGPSKKDREEARQKEGRKDQDRGKGVGHQSNQHAGQIELVLQGGRGRERGSRGKKKTKRLFLFAKPGPHGRTEN